MPLKILTDTDKMPFGKYKDLPLSDVPASYFHWLWTNDRDPMSSKINVDPVANYIHRNLNILETEYPDGIWD